MRRLGRKETLSDFTERAVDATLTGTLIPPLVYIPARLRKKGFRIDVHGDISTNAATDAENLLRIRAADPVGFLIAVMQGQPVPRVILNRNGTKITATADFIEPDMEHRMRAATALSHFKGKMKPQDAGYEAMIARAAAEKGED